ncbi:CAP domain-containing protein [Phycicoccus sp. SLBN-51]|uniref:CAP domain-containing protein n=1 Tax=Phycicoccus sp. SLBN-51 TaxID=2768447 RepID=UPI0011695714|nr:CAP domain-containing protein [Phycicoccus sp. SLBN-51]TQJ51567.1 uncharacterized protein YkwD [Phycicoccus sp. SLBN-51]
MARHRAVPTSSRQRLLGVVAVAALLAGSAGAVMAFGRESSSPTSGSTVAAPLTTPSSSPTSPPTTPTTQVSTTAPTKAVPRTTTQTTAAPTRTPARTTTTAKTPSRTAAPKPAQAAPKPAPRTTTARATSTPKPSPKPVAASSGVAAQVLTLVNAERAKAGCGALATSSALQRAAQGHSADMAANDYFSHTSQDSRTFADRIRAAGYTGGAIAENIAAGQATAGAVMTSWMDSPGHRANILNCAYRYLGVGYAKGGTYGTYWTQDFGG